MADSGGLHGEIDAEMQQTLPNCCKKVYLSDVVAIHRRKYACYALSHCGEKQIDKVDFGVAWGRGYAE